MSFLGIFCILVILYFGHFVFWSFCILVILDFGHFLFVHFLFWSFSTLVIFYFGHFVFWSFWILDLAIPYSDISFLFEEVAAILELYWILDVY